MTCLNDSHIQALADGEGTLRRRDMPPAARVRRARAATRAR